MTDTIKEFYAISNEDYSEVYVKEFATPLEARTWTQNMLDMSQTWNCDRLRWIIEKAYKQSLNDTKNLK